MIWQSITTAPTDGGPILVWDNGYEIAYYLDGGWADQVECHALSPTHWAELPPELELDPTKAF